MGAAFKIVGRYLKKWFVTLVQGQSIFFTLLKLSPFIASAALVFVPADEDSKITITIPILNAIAWVLAVAWMLVAAGIAGVRTRGSMLKLGDEVLPDPIEHHYFRLAVTNHGPMETEARVDIMRIVDGAGNRHVPEGFGVITVHWTEANGATRKLGPDGDYHTVGLLSYNSEGRYLECGNASEKRQQIDRVEKFQKLFIEVALKDPITIVERKWFSLVPNPHERLKYTIKAEVPPFMQKAPPAVASDHPLSVTS
jgi:hypothetical protein